MYHSITIMYCSPAFIAARCGNSCKIVAIVLWQHIASIQNGSPFLHISQRAFAILRVPICCALQSFGQDTNRDIKAILRMAGLEKFGLAFAKFGCDSLADLNEVLQSSLPFPPLSKQVWNVLINMLMWCDRLFAFSAR